MKTIAYAPDAWRLLNGIFCVYKPAGLNIYQVKDILVRNLVRDLNCMETRPARDFIKIKGSVSSLKPLSVSVGKNFADHPLVVGPRYQTQDVKISWANYQGRLTSGICVFGVNEGCRTAKKLKEACLLKTVEMKGEFGFATDTSMNDGKVIEKATFAHITKASLEKLTASIQSGHQAEVYKYLGIDIQSQEAYELASKGIPRIGEKSPPIIYAIHCTEFDLPHFTLEFTCVNESEDYLTDLIHQIGIYLKSCAVCCQIRVVKYGYFTLDYSLLRKHWSLENILGNIILCKELTKPEFICPSTAQFQQIRKADLEKHIKDMQEKRRSDLL